MTADAERYARLHAIFEQAHRLVGEQREALIAARCGGDLELRKELEELLAALDDPSSDALSEAGIAAGRERLEGLLSPSRGWLPERIGSYRVQRLLGQGGMGFVYEASQDSPRRRVAIKVLRPETATAQRLQRFRQEAELLGRLRHPGIAAIYEAGSFDLGQGAQPYFAMEFVEGVDLIAYAKARQLPLRARLELLVKVCDAVHHAHEQGVIHRDLKPDNVLVDPTGQPKVLDFGVARAAEGSTVLTTLVTEEGDLLGTIAYMAPEQLEGRPDLLTARSDVYGLGAIAFELLVGRLPHDLVGLPLTSALQIAKNNDPPRIGALRAELKGEVETVVGKALEREPARRYASAADFAKDLRAILEHRPIAARPPSTYYRAVKFTRRHKGLVTGAVSTLTVAVIGLIVSLAFAFRSQEYSELARAGELTARAGVMQATQDLLELGDLSRAVATYQRIAGSSDGWETALLERALPAVLPQAIGTRRPIWASDDHLMVSGDDGVVLVELGSWTRLRELGPREPAVSVQDNWMYGYQVLRRLDWRSGAELGRLELGNTPWLPVLSEDQYGVQRGVTMDPEVGAAQLWVDGRPSHLMEFSGELGLFRISPDGRWAVGLDGRGRMGVFATDSGLLHGELEGLRTSSCNPVHFDQRSTVLVFDEYNRLVRIDPERVEVLQVFSAVISDNCAFGDVSDDGSLFAWCEGGTVYVFDLVLDQVVHVERANLGGHSVDLEFSPNGRKLIAHARDLGTRIIDLDSPPVKPEDLGTELDPRAVSFTDHTGDVQAFAVSPDGRLIASMGATSPYLRVWDAGNSEPIAAYGKPVGVLSDWPWNRGQMIAFSADGQRLLASVRAGADPPRLLVADLATGATATEDLGLEGEVPTDVPVLDRFLDVLGPTGRARLGAAVVRTESEHCLAAQMRMVSAAEGARWSSILEANDNRGLALAPDGARVAVAKERRVDVYERATTQLLAQFPGKSSCVDWSPDGRLLAVGTQAGRVRFIDVNVGVELLSYQAHGGEVSCVAWMPDGSRLVSGSLDGDVRVWDPRHPTEQLEERAAYEARLDDGRRLEASQLAARRAASTSVEERWALTRVAIERSGAAEALSPTAELPDDRDLMFGGSSMRLGRTYARHASFVYTVAVSPDGRLAASMSPSDPVLYVWDVASGETLLEVAKPVAGGDYGNRSQLMAFSADGRRLLATVRARSSRPRLVVVDLLTGEARSLRFDGTLARSHLPLIGPLVELFGSAPPRRLGRMVGAAPDGTILASQQIDTFSEPPQGWIPLRGARNAEGLALSPDGERIALARSDSVALLNRRDQSVLATAPGQAYGVAWSPRGGPVAAGGVDGRIRLLDVDDLTEIESFAAHADYVFSLAWTPDGTRLVSCSGDATVKVWDTLELAERRADVLAYEARVEPLRGLTRSEIEARLESASSAAERGALIRAALEGL